MRIAEIYKSVQGEGVLTGTESVFVRASGCNLRCRFCDTPHASWQPEGADLSVHEIMTRVTQYDCGHVVLTGGEPMLFAEMLPLCESLRRTDRHITIETAGTLYLPVCCDLMSISPKLSNSTPSTERHPVWHHRHARSRAAPRVVRRLLDEYAYQLKFVIEQPQDVSEVEEYLLEHGEIDRSRVMLMPQGTGISSLSSIANWLVPLCEQHGLQFCPRKQIEWFGLIRGT